MKNKRIILIVSVFSASVFLLGLFGTSDDAIAKVNGQEITNSQVEERIQAFPPQLQQNFASQEARDQLVNQLIDELVLVAAAKKEKLHKSDEYKKQIDFASNQILLALLVQEKIDSQVKVSDSDLTDYYSQNKAQFAASQQRRASHILVKTQAEANKVRTAARNGSSFEKLAAKHSQDPGSKTRGGDLGWFEKGQLVPEFEKAVYALKKKGSISGVVKSQFGFHVIRLDGVKTRPEITFNQAKEQIRQLLVTNQKQTITQQYLETAKKKIKVKRIADENS